MTGSRRLELVAYRLGMSALAMVLAALLTLPLVALFVDGGWGSFVDGLSVPIVGSALRLSLQTTTVSVVCTVLGGTPLAWYLARSQWRSARWLETILQLPIVMPPAVGGIALLLAFGRHGLLGRQLGEYGLSVAFTTVAVVLAQIFVSAPFYLQAATHAFSEIDDDLLTVGRSLGARPPRVFLRIVLPLAKSALLRGAGMSWARALGEFGATLMFAGNMTGTTQTLPLAIYTALEMDIRTAQALSILLVLFGLALLLGLYGLGRSARNAGVAARP